MSTATARPIPGFRAPRPGDTRRWLAAAALAALAGVLGIVAGLDPALAVALALGVGFLLAVLADLVLGLAGFTLIAFLETVPALGGPALSLAKLAGALLFISWLAVISRDRGLEFFSQRPFLVALSAGFLVWAVLSALWAIEPWTALSATSRYALNLVLLPIAYSAIRKREDAGIVIATFVGGALVAALYGIIARPSVDADLDRLAGSVGDPNELAAILVAGSALALGLMGSMRRGSPSRPLLILAALVCLLAVFLTLSRGGLVSLLLTVIAAILLTRRARIPILGFAILAVLAAVVFYVNFAPPGTVERITATDGGSGRTSTWTVALRMFSDQPVVGVGAGNFAASSTPYLFEPGNLERSDLVLNEGIVTHNAYLQVLSELGVVGLALFLGIVSGCLLSSLRAARIARRVADNRLEVICISSGLGMVALLVACIFLSDQFSKQLWILLALGPALLGLATREERARGVPAAD